MAPKVLLMAVFSYIAIYGVTAKSTITGFEEKLEEILQELQKEEKRAEAGNEIEAEKVKNQEKDTASKRVFEGISGIGDITPALLTLTMDEAFRHAREIVENDEALKLFYFSRGGNIVSFDTTDNIHLLSDYGYDLLNREYIILEVRACSDALINLYHSNGEIYKVHIAVNDDSTLSIHTSAGEVASIKREFAVLDCKRYRRFLISWADNNIDVLQEDEGVGGVGWNIGLDWKDDSSNPLIINDIGFGTSGNVEGHWRTVYRGSEKGIETVVGQANFVLLQNNALEFPLVQEPHMVFQVETCGTARLALKEDDADDGKLWEISFESGNTELEVKIRRQVGRSIKSKGSIPVVDCSASLKFLVSWRNNFIQVLYQEQGLWYFVVEWLDEIGRDVSYVGVSGDASWKFYDDHEIGIDLEPGDTTAETMSGLNDMEPNLTELEIEERRANLALYALKFLIENGPIKTVDELKTIPGFLAAFEKAQKENDGKACNEERINCNTYENSPFRSIDGTCNNLQNPSWGSTGTSQRRLVGAMYADGVTAFKENGVSGQKLPSAREVSAFGMSDSSSGDPADDPVRTIMMAVMGQFYDHDITETPMVKGHKESTIGCCTITDDLVRNEREQCKIIDIDPSTDPAFSHTCMAFRRSIPRRGEHVCEPSVREQVNDITGYVDGSMVYGSTSEVAHALRSSEDGKLKVADNDLLPENDPSGCILNDPNNTHCFLAGDIRSNENPNLMVIHTAFVRYHNLLCDELIKKGVAGNDLIYNIARKIVGGILQNILYGHWLPHVIGEDKMIQEGLAVGSPFKYDETLDPSVILEFSTAAFRYGHTLVQGAIKTVGSCFKNRSETNLRDTFFNPELVFSSVDDIARSFHTTHCSAVDSELPDDLKDHLFETETALPSDLSALNIQRGRDHGLPGYVAYRVWAGLSEPSDFSEFNDHTSYFQQHLDSVYDDVKDVDLFAGGMTETVDSDTHLGPTFTAIIAEQFRRLKFGDRYYFENTEVTGFTSEQIEAIKEVTLGKIMCQVFGFDVIQHDVFAIPGIEDLQPCEDYPELNIDLFTNISD